MLELLDDRYGQRSTLVTSQIPVENWHDLIGDPTLADAIFDRLVHNAYRIQRNGESMRKQTRKLTLPGSPDSQCHPCVAAFRPPVRMNVEQVSGSAWAECPNGVESAL